MYLCSSRVSLIVYALIATILQAVITCRDVKLRDMAASIIRFVSLLLCNGLLCYDTKTDKDKLSLSSLTHSRYPSISHSISLNISLSHHLSLITSLCISMSMNRTVNMLDYALVLQSLATENRELRTANLLLQKEVLMIMHDSSNDVVVMMMCWYVIVMMW